MKTKLAVIAGTPIDTAFGKAFLETITDGEILHYAISKNPNEQNLLQLNNPEKLFQICRDKFWEFKKEGAQKIVIYCNSLSSCLDLDRLKKEIEIPLITPLDSYVSLSDQYKNILIIAANSVGAILPEKIIRQKNPNIQMTTIGYLSLVNHIESHKTPEFIFEACGLGEILAFAEKINTDLILLSCTHFPYISAIMKEHSSREIQDLDEGMRKMILGEI